MSSEHDRVLKALATHIAEHGTFPERERFRARQAPHVAAFDELEQLGELHSWRGRGLVVWTAQALSRIAGSTPFAQKELERARVVFVELVRMYDEQLGADHTVAELKGRVGFTDENQVRRALMLLRSLVFEDFSIWLAGPKEGFQISGRILTLSPDTIFPARLAEASPEAVRHLAVDPQHEARKLFLERFARPYRDHGQDVLSGSKTRKQRVIFEILVRRGLLQEGSTSGTFRLSDAGKEIALRPEAFAELWELDAPVSGGAGPHDSSESALGAGVDHELDSPSSWEGGVPTPWDAALHQVIDYQDELGLLADALFAILRRGRSDSQSSAPGAQPNLEIGVLEKAVLAGGTPESSARAAAILNTVAGMEAVTELLRRPR